MSRELVLYGYFRSSASYRVRIALNLKKIAYRLVPVHLVRDGGEHRKDWFRAVNPQMRVPALQIEDAGRTETITQSSAIIEWLEEIYPEPALLPSEPLARAHVRALAAIVSNDIHPLNNSGPLNYIRKEFGRDEADIKAWCSRWITDGLSAIEQLIQPGPFATGATPTLADVCLVPQVFSARRFSVPLDAFPKIVAIDRECQKIEAFIAAEPQHQPDAE